MALADIGAPIIWPAQWFITTPSDGNISATLDAAGEYIAFITVAREAMVVSHVGFWNQNVAGSPTVDVRVESVDTDGLPSGTLIGTDTNIVTGALSGSAWSLHALTGAATIAAGTMFAVKLAYATGTSVVIRQISGAQPWSGGTSSRPYRVLNVGTPTKAGIGVLPMALGSNSTTFYKLNGVVPFSSGAATAFNNTDDARQGVRFQVPCACRCTGLVLGVTNATGNYAVALLDDSGNELSSSSTAYDGDHYTLGFVPMFSAFDSPVSLSPGTWYRAVLTPTTSTNVVLPRLTLPSADYRSAMPGGTNFFLTTFTTSGGWVDSGTAIIPTMALMIDQLDDGAGAGGGAPGHGNMTGGMQ